MATQRRLMLQSWRFIPPRSDFILSVFWCSTYSTPFSIWPLKVPKTQIMQLLLGSYAQFSTSSLRSAYAQSSGSFQSSVLKSPKTSLLWQLKPRILLQCLTWWELKAPIPFQKTMISVTMLILKRKWRGEHSTRRTLVIQKLKKSKKTMNIQSSKPGFGTNSSANESTMMKTS